ncbi:hypothetical protein I4902_18665 [Proteus alimentorum]|uniref:Cro/Cl family transcriptional regulator n=1 Tax=Proteus alimentorum TaxID=1973495 RepID=A0ABS0J0X7_9GAMM|nr:Cro/CI family transcriptional regulator [Proteus alimentorum]MBG2877637.1 hypothetical protein [Proteus alimentorum]MBG2881267.1 hypothetical protein [Proteus alimentorum]
MNELALRDYVKEYGQDKTAKAIRVTQGAISKALRDGRNIILSHTENGIKAIEIKPFPRTKK